MSSNLRITILSGGVGGARLVDAMVRGSDAQLAVIVNTGDDFEHLALTICPDLDTVMYTLAGLAPPARGWGLKEESFNALERVRDLGGPDWFQLGDRDLATHLLRRAWMSEGATLSDVTSRLFQAHGVSTRVYPMSDTPQRTFIETEEGTTYPFQDWLVRERARPRVSALRYEGDKTLSDGAQQALSEADVVVIAPSNPWTSIHPILALEGVTPVLREKYCVAVSPLIGGAAVKGPLREMVHSLRGEIASSASIIAAYEGLLDALVVHPGDGESVSASTATRVIEHDIRLVDVPARDRFGRWLTHTIQREFAGHRASYER